MQDEKQTDQLVTNLKPDTEIAFRFCSWCISSAVELTLKSCCLVRTCQDEMKLLFINMVPRNFTQVLTFTPKTFWILKDLFLNHAFKYIASQAVHSL